MTTVLDANVMIAALQSQDAHHAQVVEFLRTTTDDLCVPLLTLAESLVWQARQGRADAALSVIIGMGVRILPCDLTGALDLATVRAATDLRMPDCVVLASAQAIGAKLATTDQKLAREAAKTGIKLAL